MVTSSAQQVNEMRALRIAMHPAPMPSVTDDINSINTSEERTRALMFILQCRRENYRFRGVR